MVDLTKATQEELAQLGADLQEAIAGKNLQMGAFLEIENDLKAKLSEKIAQRLGENTDANRPEP